jgi:hypothetical protein
MKNKYTIFVRNSEVKRPLGRPGHRWEDNIKINLKNYHNCVGWSHLVQDRDL